MTNFEKSNKHGFVCFPKENIQNLWLKHLTYMVRLESKLSLAVTTSGSKMWLADLLAHKKLLKVYSPNTFSPNSELTKLLQATKLKTCRCTSNPNFLAPNYLTWACSISTFQNTSSHPKVLNEPPNFHHTITPSTMDSSLLVDFIEGGRRGGVSDAKS